MARFPFVVHGRGRVLLPLVALLALALVVAGVLVAVAQRVGIPEARRLPQGRTTAEPAEIVSSRAPAPPQSARPNIVTIVTDDMRTDDLRWMPHVRRAGRRTRAWTSATPSAPNPLCAPARSSLLTGQYSHNTGVLAVTPPTELRGLRRPGDRRDPPEPRRLQHRCSSASTSTATAPTTRR